jgi:molybdopterin molybdotransferase
VTLPVVADLPAGVGRPERLPAGAAARIMTGAPFPAGADGVVPVEWTDAGAERVRIERSPRAGQYVRRAGEDVRAGERVLSTATRLTARHVALAAAVGRDTLRVRTRPRVVVVSTGSELVKVGGALAYGQVYDSNGPSLLAAAAELGCDAELVGPVPDDPEVLLAALRRAAAVGDVVLTSGGVSAGAYDTVKEVLRAAGGVEFVRVAMQPGMPQGLGVLGEGLTPVFTLPGNPVSTMVSFEVFVRPALRKMAGESRLHRHSVPAVVEAGWSSPAGKRQFVRGRLRRLEDGSAVVEKVGGHGSHLIADLAEANCLVVVPEEVSTVHAGDTLRCLLLDRTRR